MFFSDSIAFIVSLLDGNRVAAFLRFVGESIAEATEFPSLGLLPIRITKRHVAVGTKLTKGLPEKETEERIPRIVTGFQHYPVIFVNYVRKGLT